MPFGLSPRLQRRASGNDLTRRVSQARWALLDALADRWEVGTRASVGSGPSASLGCVVKLDFLLDPLVCVSA